MPLAELLFSKALLQIQVISIGFVCTKNAYCSSTADSSFYKLPQMPSASAPSKHDTVTCNFALTLMSVVR